MTSFGNVKNRKIIYKGVTYWNSNLWEKSYLKPPVIPLWKVWTFSVTLLVLRFKVECNWQSLVINVSTRNVTMKSTRKTDSSLRTAGEFWQTLWGGKEPVLVLCNHVNQLWLTLSDLVGITKLEWWHTKT